MPKDFSPLDSAVWNLSYFSGIQDSSASKAHILPWPWYEITGSGIVWVKCCFMSTERVQTIRDGEPRMATPTITQLQVRQHLNVAKSGQSKLYMCVCMCVCTRTWVCGCVCARGHAMHSLSPCVRVSVCPSVSLSCVCVCVCVCACMLCYQLAFKL